MAEDTLPLTYTDEHGEVLGMFFVDDFDLFNFLIQGREYVILKADLTKSNSPFWIKVVPVHSGTLNKEESYTKTISDLQERIRKLEEELEQSPPRP